MEHLTNKNVGIKALGDESLGVDLGTHGEGVGSGACLVEGGEDGGVA